MTYVSKQLSLAAVNYLLDSTVCALVSGVSKLLNNVIFFLSFLCSFIVINLEILHEIWSFDSQEND